MTEFFKDHFPRARTRVLVREDAGDHADVHNWISPIKDEKRLFSGLISRH